MAASTRLTAPRGALRGPQRTAPTQRSHHVCGALPVASASYRGSLSTTAKPPTFTATAGPTARHAAPLTSATAVASMAVGAHAAFGDNEPQPQCSVLVQFIAVQDYPKLIRALALVSCGNLRSPATALLGLALLEEATQQPYDLISLE